MTRSPTMRSLVEQYLEHPRSLGFQLKIEGQQLLNFADHADHSGHCGPLTADMAVRCATLPEGCSQLYHARRLEVVRCFARHRTAFDPATEIPPPGLLGRAHYRPTPSIYIAQQLEQLVQAAMELKPVGALRPLTYATLLGLLPCRGHRISEALQLQREDVDLEHNVLQIRESKFRKSRPVPLHPSTGHALQRYARARDEPHPPAPAETFFVGRAGQPLPYTTARTVWLLAIFADAVAPPKAP